ncbi:MAG: hypothetical protein N3F66_14540 [Spirochaetes bacterium]|nr:hypothetical protein [Spirochaetota bacterium]
MKKCAITLLIIFIMFNCIYSAQKSFVGRVIYKANDYIEVKYGKTERIFYVNDKSIFTQNKTNVTFSNIEVCQTVKLSYTISNNKMFILTCDILKDSDCK